LGATKGADPLALEACSRKVVEYFFFCSSMSAKEAAIAAAKSASSSSSGCFFVVPLVGLDCCNCAWDTKPEELLPLASSKLISSARFKSASKLSSTRALRGSIEP
jgi:hypothetical protein